MKNTINSLEELNTNSIAKVVENKQIKLTIEAFGKPSHPAILLIAGAASSMLYWDEFFCRKLSAKGFFVIRYDNRDTGESTTFKPDTINYTIVDMADDAKSILDSYKITKAHIMGISLGGLIAQIFALKYPENVNSLILMSTGYWGEISSDIPAMDDAIIKILEEKSKIDWNDETQVLTYLLKISDLMLGSKPLNMEREQFRIKQEFRRANNYQSMFNHSLIQGGEDFFNRIDEINVPCLIIHGTKDKIWHYKNAEFLHSNLRNSKLLELLGTGHELNPIDWNEIVNSIDNFIQI